MNMSGPALKPAWKMFKKDLADDNERQAARLVVLHDDLELPFGRIVLRTSYSARGHNGLKSVRESLGSEPFMKIRIGIGRCESRESVDVARYVMRQMKPTELELLRGKVGEVLVALNEVRHMSLEV